MLGRGLMSTSLLLMAMKALRDWAASGPTHRNSKVEVLKVEPFFPESVDWKLPPSKSHLIRWLLIAALRDKPTKIHGASPWGEDADSMRRCLNQMGFSIPSDDEIEINPVSFSKPATVLHAGNSGTSCRFLMALAACLDFQVMIDGDESLRNRSHSVLLDALAQSGAQISHGFGAEKLPVIIQGPMSAESVSIEVGNSSQPFSALLLTRTLHNMSIESTGEPVSENHSNLTKRLLSDDSDIVVIPKDASMAAFARLFSLVHSIDVPVQIPADDLGHRIPEVIPELLNLKDCNDLLPPLAAMMALGDGGKIMGASHASLKESDRIKSTQSMLSRFGITSKATPDGLEIAGNQRLSQPEGSVKTYSDHRIQMTAVILATKVGGIVEGPRLHRVADPDFLKRLVASGAMITEDLLQP